MKMHRRLLAAAVACLLNAFASSDGAPSEDLVVHEWGTFTSVQGSNGVPIAWNPFETVDLPDFVYELNKVRNRTAKSANPAVASKATTHWLQRMETPVVYFYTGQPLTVDVAVKFPQGLITEWYPQVARFGPAPAMGSDRPATSDSFVQWSGIQLLPGSGGIDDKRLPQAKLPSHYFAARHTDSAIVRSPAASSTTGTVEHEKFLFYRGVGSFTAPLRVSSWDAANIILENTGKDPLAGLFILDIRPEGAALLTADPLKPSERRELSRPAKDALRPIAEIEVQIAKLLEKSLVKEGLYPREAAAMVNTWRDSWFQEMGVRVLYVLPRSWTDRVLPMSITPAPKELVRLMIGRAEIFTPETEQTLREQFTRSQDPRMRSEAVAAIRQLQLGRFLEPALSRTMELETQDLYVRIQTLKADLTRPASTPLTAR